jgi:hypothetical protein
MVSTSPAGGEIVPPSRFRGAEFEAKTTLIDQFAVGEEVEIASVV